MPKVSMKIARSDARILAHGLLAEGLDVASLSYNGKLELARAIDKLLDLCGIKDAEIVSDADAGKSANVISS
jgi:hypothetical protein